MIKQSHSKASTQGSWSFHINGHTVLPSREAPKMPRGPVTFGGVTPAVALRVVGERQEVDTRRPGPWAKHCDAQGVAAKGRNVLTGPAESLDQVEEAVVPLGRLVSRAQEACQRGIQFRLGSSCAFQPVCPPSAGSMSTSHSGQFQPSVWAKIVHPGGEHWLTICKTHYWFGVVSNLKFEWRKL